MFTTIYSYFSTSLPHTVILVYLVIGFFVALYYNKVNKITTTGAPLVRSIGGALGYLTGMLFGLLLAIIVWPIVLEKLISKQ